MASDQDSGGNAAKSTGVSLVTVLVLLGVLSAGWRELTGKGEESDHAAVAAAGQDDDTGTGAGVDPGVFNVSAQGWVKPVNAGVWDGFRTTSRPGHDGVDLGASRNTPIRAASAGTVVRMRCDARLNGASYGCDRDGSWKVKGCGWFVDVQHAGMVFTRYCHMQSRPLVSEGDTVAVGQVIGYVGSTGNSGTPHLHFEVHQGARGSAYAVDPVAFMRARGAPLGVG